MQLLLANHVLNNQEVLAKAIKARVVLANEMFLNKEATPSRPQAKPGTEKPQFSYPLPGMKKQQIISLSEDFIRKAKKLEKELVLSEKRYRKEYNESYEAALNRYNQNAAPIIEGYNAEVERARQDWCSIRPNEFEYNPKDPCHQPPSVPFPTLPEFEFKFDDEISAGRFAKNLSSDSWLFLAEILDFKGEKDPKEVDMTELLEDFETYSELNNFIGVEINIILL